MHNHWSLSFFPSNIFAKVEPNCEDIGPAYLYVTFHVGDYKFKYIFPTISDRVHRSRPSAFNICKSRNGSSFTNANRC